MTRGVRQGGGGVASTGFYLVFADGLLLELEASGLGATMCSVRSGNPGFVDDLASIATSPAVYSSKSLYVKVAYPNTYGKILRSYHFEQKTNSSLQYVPNW